MTPKFLAAPLLLTALTCSAQLEFPPDQVDLQSSYCLGVLNARASIQSEFVSGARPITDDLRPALATMISVNNAGLKRLRSYLAVRYQTIEPTGLFLATAQGKRDVATAAGQIEGCSTADCKVSPDLQAKFSRCDGLSFLPY